MSICVITVIYHPDLNVIQTQIDRLASENVLLCIVDNTPGGWADINRLIIPKNNLFGYLKQGRNIGLAGAQNLGISWARDHRAKLVLLMDQDSMPHHFFLQHLQSCYQKLQLSGEKIAAVGPRHFDSRMGLYLPVNSRGLFWIKRISSLSDDGFVSSDFIIASGCLIPMSVFREVGVMNEELFIDMIDLDWGFRATQLGFSSFTCSEAVLEHSLGNDPKMIPLMSNRFIAQHSPTRHYYQIRNIIYLCKQSYTPVVWKVYLLSHRLILRPFADIFLWGFHWDRIKMLARGVRDGLGNRLGEFTD